MVTNTAICNFAHDATIFAADSYLAKALERLEIDALVLLRWFPENFMKWNEGKYHLLALGQSKTVLRPKLETPLFKKASKKIHWG